MLTKSNDRLNEIGGYFELELPDHGDPFPGRLKYQSARAALRAALEHANIKHVLLPEYICDAVTRAAMDSGSTVQRYTLDNSLYPQDLPNPLPRESVVLYVNYFGLCDANVKRLLGDIPAKQLIIDNSQALFSPHEDTLASIYSIRKFMGVPDGGLLASSLLDLEAPDSEDTASIDRMRALLLRAAYPASSGYDSYLDSEKSLADTRPVRMSRLTNRLLASIDIDAIKLKRRDNFLALAKQLDKYNLRSWLLEAGSAPLCYPLLINRDAGDLREILIKKGIYTPVYWPETTLRAATDSSEYQLSNCCLFLPCDQRYTTARMGLLAEEVIASLPDK